METAATCLSGDKHPNETAQGRTDPAALQREVEPSAPRRLRPCYWQAMVTWLLTEHADQLSERDVSFLANVQYTTHRSAMPSAAQINWICSIQRRLKDSEHGC